MKVDILFARFPYQNAECPDSSDWLLSTVNKCKKDPRIGEMYSFRPDDTPIPMTRNQAVAQAQRLKVDYLLMLDSDMDPDLPGEQPFWDTSFDFMLNQGKPCVVAAPYCGPPPCCNVYVFRYTAWANNSPNPDWKLSQFGREEAALQTGIKPVHALPTGLILLDMRVFSRLQPPYFYYEWSDQTQTQKSSTEDVAFTRDLTMRGVPIYCNWDSWAGHWKRFRVDKPRFVTVENISEKYKEAILKDRSIEDRMVDVTPAGLPGNDEGKLVRTPLEEACDNWKASLERSTGRSSNWEVAPGFVPANGQETVKAGV